MTRLVVAITGASGAAIGVSALRLLQDHPDVETHLIVTSAGRRTLAQECAITFDEVLGLADRVHREGDIGGPLASGSFQTVGMLIAPCSIKTLSGVANSYDDNLVVRAADVCLKERRRLVMLVRETPLNALHLRLMSEVTLAGGVIMPPVPAFYHRPASLEEACAELAAHALSLCGVSATIRQWDPQPEQPPAQHK